MIKHVYLSPHLDDAVLSCGGAIHRLSASGEAVQVVTLFAGDPAPESDLSPFARLQQRHWGNPPRPMALRRAEDGAARVRLGAGGQHLDYLDAVYRTAPDGGWLYDGEEKLWGEFQPADALAQDSGQGVADRLAALFAPPESHLFYAPLAVGRHVDHQIVRLAAQRLLSQGYRVAFYEDYPYSEDGAAVQAAVQMAGAEPWRPELVALTAADLRAKVEAIGYYRSQMAVLFGGAQAMPNRVWAFAASRTTDGCLAERLWWPPEP